MSGICILRSLEERVSEMKHNDNRALTMSYKEREYLKILTRLGKGKLTCCDAAESLGISERHLYWLRARYRQEGDEGLIHRLRCSLSNRGYPRKVCTRILELYRERYGDYGPTLFAEMITKEHTDTFPSVDHDNSKVSSNRLIAESRFATVWGEFRISFNLLIDFSKDPKISFMTLTLSLLEARQSRNVHRLTGDQ